MRERSNDQIKPELKIDSHNQNQVEKDDTESRTEPTKEKDSANSINRRRAEMQNPLMHESY